MRKIIINADDLGYSLSVNQQIENCIINKVITSSTLMANAPGFDDGVRIAKQYENISVGVHLNIVEFKPLTNSEIFRKHGVVGENGDFLDGAIFITPIDAELKYAISKEWDAQISKIKGMGIIPSHIDSHQHTHMIPALQDVLCELMRKHDIKRVRRKQIPLIRLMLFGSKEIPIRLDKSKSVNVERKSVLYRRLHLLRVKCYSYLWNKSMRKYFQMTDAFFPLRNFYLDRSLLNLGGKESVTELMCHPGQQAFQNETDVLENLYTWLPRKYELINYTQI